ncbi:protein translocase SEC61 complex subunit gamma [Candidatus Woesearchaeota archaeon]|nr:protein translocase SEC61 complex subunit gamma [Candidatus Woesearchaeota archaeon]
MSENSLLHKMKRTGKEYLRVLRVTKKPSNEEFKTIVKISGLGMLLIGLIGFLLQLLWVVFRGG